MPGDRGRGASRVVRPYAITGGRTGSAGPELALEALVFADPAAVVAARLSDERRAIAMLCAEVMSVAEISAHLGIPVGVVRVLVGDLVADGQIHLYRPGTPDARPTSPSSSGSWRASGRSGPKGDQSAFPPKRPRAGSVITLSQSAGDSRLTTRGRT